MKKIDSYFCNIEKCQVWIVYFENVKWTYYSEASAEEAFKRWEAIRKNHKYEPGKLPTNKRKAS